MCFLRNNAIREVSVVDECYFNATLRQATLSHSLCINQAFMKVFPLHTRMDVFLWGSCSFAVYSSFREGHTYLEELLGMSFLYFRSFVKHGSKNSYFYDFFFSFAECSFSPYKKYFYSGETFCLNKYDFVTDTFYVAVGMYPLGFHYLFLLTVLPWSFFFFSFVTFYTASHLLFYLLFAYTSMFALVGCSLYCSKTYYWLFLFSIFHGLLSLV